MRSKNVLMVFLFMAAVLFGSTVSTRAEMDQIKVAEVSGAVQVLRGGDAAKTETAAAGLLLKIDDVVTTGPASSAKIDMGTGNAVQLEANSKLKIGLDPRAPKLDLLGGKLLSRLKTIPKGKQVTIGTPTSIAGVEGTTFAVAVANNGSTSVDVLSGKVRVQSAGEAGKFASVTAMQRVRVSAWENTEFVATGSGTAPERYNKHPTIREGDREIMVVRASAVGADETAAREAALRELGERVFRAEIAEQKTVGDLAAGNKIVYEKLSALVADAAVTNRQAREDGSVQVQVQVDTAKLNAALGQKAPVFTSAMVQLSDAQYAPIYTTRGRMAAEKAAQLAADRNLLEQIQGILINSETTVQNFALQNDQVTSRVEGVIRGAETVSTRYFSDGTVEVTRRVKGADVRLNINAVVQKEILGAHYMGKPVELDPVGYEALRRFGQ
ncbi:MAG: FecR domain-containing protein [Planctomycetota bacterium]